MNWKKFEYFLNAVHYCIWRADIKMSTIIDRVLDVLFYPIIILLPHKMRQSHTEYLETTKKETTALLHGKTRGWYNGWANHWFGLVYSSYPVYLSFILTAFTFRIYGRANTVWLIVFGIPIALGYIAAYKAVFSKDRYKKYHKKFIKEDVKWHKKWKSRTIAFCVGSVISFLLGIVSAFVILLWGHL